MRGRDGGVPGLHGPGEGVIVYGEGGLEFSKVVLI